MLLLVSGVPIQHLFRALVSGLQMTPTAAIRSNVINKMNPKCFSSFSYFPSSSTTHCIRVVVPDQKILETSTVWSVLLIKLHDLQYLIYAMSLQDQQGQFDAASEWTSDCNCRNFKVCATIGGQECDQYFGPTAAIAPQMLEHVKLRGFGLFWTVFTINA